MRKRIIATIVALLALATPVQVNASWLNPVSTELTFREVERAEWVKAKVDDIKPSSVNADENMIFCVYRGYWVVSYYADVKADVQVGDDIELLIIDEDKFLEQRVIDAR